MSWLPKASFDERETDTPIPYDSAEDDTSNAPLTELPTPPACIADFCLIPIGTPSASVSQEVAQVQRLLKQSGLHYSMHSAGTTVEGSWEDCMRVIGQCHTMLHKNGVVRIQSDIRVGSRTDKKQTFQDKVSAVQTILAKDASASRSHSHDDSKKHFRRRSSLLGPG